MLRYLFALIPGLALFALFYVSKSAEPGEINVLLRDTGRVAFLYLSLALLVTPVITLSGKQWMAKYRRTFGVLAFVFAIAHASKYFFDEYTYQETLFVAKHFLESDVWSGTLAFVLMAILGITSNDASVRFLRSHWKPLQTLAYPLFLIAALHVAFASRFEDFYVVVISAVVALRTFAFLKKRKILPVSAVGGSATKYLCVPCGYVYDETVGDVDGGIPP
jgi:sulfoxide reductase heme-binding subunit YedZ